MVDTIEPKRIGPTLRSCSKSWNLVLQKSHEISVFLFFFLARHGPPVRAAPKPRAFAEIDSLSDIRRTAVEAVCKLWKKHNPSDSYLCFCCMAVAWSKSMAAWQHRLIPSHSMFLSLAWWSTALLLWHDLWIYHCIIWYTWYFMIFHDIMIWGGCVHRVAQVRPLELALERPMDQWAGCLHVRILENPQEFSESEINTWTFWILNYIDIGIFKMAKWYAKYFRYFENVLICPNPSTFSRSTSQFLGGHVQDAVRGVCISGQKCKRQNTDAINAMICHDLQGETCMHLQSFTSFKHWKGYRNEWR